MKIGFRLVIVFLVTITLAACGGDDGPNVALTEVSAPDAGTYSPGQPFAANFKVTTDRIDAEHIGVNFFIIEQSKASQLENDEEADEYDVGTFYIDQLVDGEQTYTADLFVPNDIIESGEFLLVAYIDTAGVIQDEPSDRDNLSQNVTASSDPTWATMTIDAQHHHDFILSKIEIGEGFLLLPEPIDHDETESEEPDTFHSDLIGFIDAIKHGSDVDTGEVVGKITVAGIDYEAHFWHEFDGTYTKSFELVFPNHEEEHYFPFDIALNGELVHALEDAYDESAAENTFELTLTIVDTSADIEDDSTNNSQTIEVPYFFFEDEDVIASTKSGGAPLPSGKITSRSGFYEVSNDYNHTYGDKSKVAIEMSFENYITLQSSDASAEAYAGGGFFLHMFNNSATLFSSELGGQIQVGALDGEYNLDIVLLGSTLLSRGDTVYEFSEEWSREWGEEVTIFETTFVIVIVPVKLEAGIEGSVGLSAGIEADAGVITATGTPFSLGLDAFAEASINLLVASGGVRADFLILSEELTAEAYADMSGFLFSGAIDLGLDITNDLKAVEGNFSLFVRYPGYKFCCKFFTKEASKTIYNTGALYDKSWTLLSVERSINL